MEEEAILSSLEKIFRNVLNNQSLNLSREMSAKDVDEWTSLNHMILVSEVEKAFSVKFKFKDLKKMQNIGDMIDVINSKL